MTRQLKDDQIIEAYNLLCLNLYIESAIAVVEESFSTLMLLKDPDVVERVGFSDGEVATVGLESREFLMRLIDDPDGILLPDAIHQFVNDRAAFRENTRYRSILRGAWLREGNGYEPEEDRELE